MIGAARAAPVFALRLVLCTALGMALALPSRASLASPGIWILEREDNFASGSAFDPAFWTPEAGFVRNQEKQYYSPANIRTEEGVLRIEARREQLANAAHRVGSRGWRQAEAVSQYTSGSIVSRKAFLFGRVEVVARSPVGAGVWPAIWLVHESPGRYGEIDIFEAVGKHPDTAFAGVHWGREPDTRQHRNNGRRIAGFDGRWHRHAVEWTPQRIAVFVDDDLLFEFDPSDAKLGGADPLRSPMKLHLNLALGGTWGGAIDDGHLPARFDIASIRIWRMAEGDTVQAQGEAPLSSPSPSPSPSPAPSPSPTPVWGR